MTKRNSYMHMYTSYSTRTHHLYICAILYINTPTPHVHVSSKLSVAMYCLNEYSKCWYTHLSEAMDYNM